MSEKINKYPRTPHLTFSPGCTNDDKMLETDDFFLNKEIVITSKLDGSNFCMSGQECFARSHSGPPTHKSFDWAKSFHNQIKYLIPDNLVIYSEYLFAKHSIHYLNLPHYLCIFNILDNKKNIWLSWAEVMAHAQALNIPTTPILFEGSVDNHFDFKKLCLSLMEQKEFQTDEREGIVVRMSNEFSEENFPLSMGKIVRANHIQTSEHWKNQEIIRNKLKI